MLRRWTTPALAAALVSLLISGIAPLAAGAAPVKGFGPGAAATVRAITVTGDVVTVVRAAGGRVLTSVAGSGTTAAAKALRTVRIKSDTYVFPATAVPFLGRGLDPNLFDVTKLAGRERVPVRLTFTGSLPAVPGVTVTSTGTGTASGYLTAAGARAFGAALARAYAAGAATKWASSSLFGLTALTADVPGTPVVRPLFPMRTLILRAVDRAGAPVPFGFVGLLDVKDGRAFTGFTLIVNGEARVSVPIGPYAVIAALDDVAADGTLLGSNEVAVDGYSVASQNQVLTLDARKATATVSVTTPKPADRSLVVFDWERTDATGLAGIGFGFGAGAEPLRVTPQAPPTSGTLTSLAGFSLVSPASAASPYSYDAQFGPTSGVAASQAYTIRASELETIASSYSAPRAGVTGAPTRLVINPGQTNAFTSTPFVPLPLSRTEYVRGEPGAVRLDSLASILDEATFAIEFLNDGPRLVAAGRSSSVDWSRPPAAPQVPTVTDGTAALFGGADCPACRTPSTLRIFVAPAEDTVPGHSYGVFLSADGSPVARFQLLQGSTVLYDANDSAGTEVTVPAASATYTVIDDVNRGPSDALLGTTSHTELTFRSASTGSPAAPACSLGTGCTVLPLLRADVALPVDALGTVPVGTSTIRLTLSHIAGATATAITGGTVEVRAAGGAWTRLPTASAGAGVYTATLTTTAAQVGQRLDLRVTGTDAAGGSISQAVTAAFAVRP